MRQFRHSPIAGSFTIAFGFVLVTLCVSLIWPDMRPQWMLEDGLLEWLSAIFFLGASVPACLKWNAAGRKDVVLLAVGVLSIIAALDELSFGQRLFGFTPPVVNGVRIDGVHDLLLLTKDTIKKMTPYPYTVAVLLTTVAVWLAGFTYYKFRTRFRDIVLRGELWLPITAVCFITLAQVLDLHPKVPGIEFVTNIFFEEILETTAGLLMVMFVIERLGIIGKQMRGRFSRLEARQD